MERRWNLATLMGLALLFLASTAAAADSNPAVAEEQESVAGGKFCYSYTISNGIPDDYVFLAQRPSSYEPNPPPYDEENYVEYHEYCADTWLDFAASWAAYLEEMDSRELGIALHLETDLDFGGVNSDSTACNEEFKPLAALSRFGRMAFYGNHYTIKNLCLILPSISSDYIADYVNPQTGDDDFGMGFFAELKGATVQEVNFENVYIKVNNANPYYKVPTGALVGWVGSNGSSEFRDITMKNVKIVASQAGGLVGYVHGEDPIFNNIIGENVEVYAATGTVASSIDEGNFWEYEDDLAVYLGGVVGQAEAGVTIVNAGISGLKIHTEIGSIDLLEEAPDEGQDPAVIGSEDISQAMGGIVGIVDGTQSNGYLVVIANTYTVGDISAPNECYSVNGGVCRIGFVSGEIRLNEDYFIGSNYHYGESDYMAEGVAGYLEKSSNLTPTWSQQNIGNGAGNFRNTVEDLDSPSQAEFDEADYTWTDGTTYGGDISGDLMKKDAFAMALTTQANGRYSTTAWSRKDGVNNGLPVFASSTLKPIYQITFFASSDMFSSLPTATQQEWENANATINADGASLSVLTNYTGKLSNSTWQETAAQITSEGYYWSYTESDGWNSQTKALAISSSTIFRSSMDLVLGEKFNIPVVHCVWNGDETSQGYAENINVSQVTPVDEVTGLDYYYLGTPFDEVTADTSWAVLPWLAIGLGDDEYRYYQPVLYIQRCSGGECSGLTRFTKSNGAAVRFYNEAVLEMSSEDVLYVVYDRSKNKSELDGSLFVADLHGASYGDGEVYVTISGLQGGDVNEFYHSYLNIQSDPTDSLAKMVRTLVNESGAWQFEPYYLAEVPFAPYMKADYPSDMWGSVDGVVGLVVVGSNQGSASSAAQLMSDALDTLVGLNFNHPLLKDTLASLESPEDIYNYMVDHVSAKVSYARFVNMGRDRTIDLTNLIAVVRTFRFYTGDLPIFVGLMPRLHNVEYHVTFDVEAKFYGQDEYYNSLFVADPWLENEGIQDVTYTRDNKDDDFFSPDDWRLVKTDGCYRGGWSFLPFVNRGDEVFDIHGIYVLEYQEEFSLDELPIETNDDGSKSLTLYTYWETDQERCLESQPRRVQWDDESESQVWDNAIIKDKSKLGNIVLQQVWAGDTLRHKSVSLDGEVMGIVVPRAEELSYTFKVLGEGMPGYELDGDITFSYLDRRQETNGGGSVVTKKLKDGDALTITPGMYENMEFSAKFTLKTYNIVFVPELENVLYGENSPREGTYKLKDEEDSIDLPVWVYTADRCVAGWVPSSISEELEGMNELGDYIWDEYLAEEEEAWWGYSQFDFELSTYLDEEAKYYEEFKGTYFLYGFWVPAKLCVQEFSYKQAKLTAENGTVQFKELLKDSDGKVTGSQVHSFAKDGTMLLPYGTKADNNYVVVSVPKNGYVLDSLVMNVGGKKTTYREGDTLSGDIYKATFTAYFVEDNQTPMEFVKMDLQPSGNAVRLELSTTEFRAGGAKLRVTLENNDGKKLVDTLLAKTITKTPYSGEWEYYPLAAGTYLVTATLIRGKETFVLEKDFEVKAEIATVVDGWRMISLANVNMDSVAWKGDDAKFFWWDETSPFGVIWQYQEFKRGDEVDPLVGYWYSSLSGRSLVTRKDAYTPKNPVAWKLDSLYSGWNLVANPYGWYVNLYGENSASKKDATEKPDVEFLSWNDSLGSYEPVSVVGPNEAVWVQVDGPRTWKLPAKPEYVGLVDEEGETSVVKPLKKTVEVGTFGKNRWAIRAVLSDAKGKRDGWNILGVSETAWNSEEPPAGMGDRVNLSIMEGKKGLAKSFKKASGDSYEWTISLDASGNRMGFLHFEGIRALNAEGLKVFVTVDGETTQMNEGDTLKVALGSMAKTATVRVAPSARVTVAQKLDGLRALHTGSGLQVSFNVSESLAGQRIRVELLDTKGKVLSSASGKAVSGSNSMQVDTPKSGLYMVRVRVGSKQAVVNVLVK